MREFDKICRIAFFVSATALATICAIIGFSQGAVTPIKANLLTLRVTLNFVDFDVYTFVVVTALAAIVVVVAVVVLLFARKQLQSDIQTQHQEAELNSKLFQAAVSMSEVIVYRYIIAEQKLVFDTETARRLGTDKHFFSPSTLLDNNRILTGTDVEYRAFYENIHSGQTSSQCVIHFIDDFGRVRWAKLAYSLVGDKQGNPIYAVISHYDITTQQENTAQLEMWQAAIESYGGQSIRSHKYNLSKNIPVVDRAEVTGSTDIFLSYNTYDKRHEYITNNFVYSEDRNAYDKLTSRKSLIANFLNGKTTTSLEYRVETEGEVFWRRVDIKMLREFGSEDIISYNIVSDIDKATRERLETQRRAEIDALTGLFNRDAFTQKAKRIIDTSMGQQCSHAFVYIDIDGFKRVNDTYGHQEGDSVLSKIAAIITSILHPSDFAGRMGGDEFMIILNNMPYYSAVAMRLESLREAISHIGVKDIELSASIGISSYPADGINFNELYEKADKALYMAKQRGKNDVVFYREEEASSYPEIRDENTRISRVLIADRHQEELYWLETTLRQSYRCKAVDNVNDAKETITQYGAGISLIVIDRGDPATHGYDLMKFLQGSKTLASIPVLMIVDENDARGTLDALAMGATECISRPVDKNLLLLKAETCIAKSKSNFEQIQHSYDSVQNEQEMLYRSVLLATETIVIEYDIVSKIFTFDKSIGEYLHGNYDGRTLTEIILQDRVITHETNEYITQKLTEMVNGNKREIVFNIQVVNKKKELRWFRVVAVRPGFGIRKRLILTLQDVDEEYLANQKMNYLAKYDSLTKIHNAFGFAEATAKMISADEFRQYCIINLRLGNFKLIKPMFGENVADNVLITVAREIEMEVGEPATYGRISADSFVICLPYERNTIERRISSFVSKTYHAENYEIELQLYFGICLTEPDVAIEALCDRAEAATIKAMGNYLTSFAYYDRGLHEQLSLQQELIISFNTALANDEFELYYQPQINYITKIPEGSEALVRWNHPTRGVISPGTFIPIFEQNGSIVKLDKYVWDKAARQVRKWLDEGKRVLPVSVNVSQVDMYNPDLCDSICEIVDKYNVDRRLIRFEITESAQAEAPEVVIKTIKKLRKLGFITEMDDFGCGYSSLTTLKDLPVNILKINARELLPAKDIDAIINEKSPRNIILGTVIQLTKDLGFEIIAEGIETLQEAENVHRLGCDIIQGYYYSKPLKVEEFENRYL